MPFHEIEIPLAGADPQALESALADAGAIAVSFFDRGDEPILEPRPGEFRLWRDTLVRALFDDALDPATCLCRLTAVLGPRILAGAKLRRVADRAWEREWLVDWSPLRFGPRLWVCPSSAQPPADRDAIVVRLDPGLAFGTGTHPTTALCLEALAALDLRGKTVIDYGCGSGILAIAALKLGAARAHAIDIDPQALAAAAANAAANGVADRLRRADAAAVLPGADCVVANILASTLIEVRERLAAACRAGGDLLLSGILVAQTDAVTAAYRETFAIVGVARREDWCCIRARRRTEPAS
ncbi:MAG TPA: 50S ribosomal protein L11 methyltransferase [Steroidobacteraceae bacterium]|nr:50S ribosomal protein L11 methyltransferase [Steroidobacteraceae bacterium]